MDAIPVLSQTKSLFQAVFGDTDGARRTQENFSRQCPIVSQVRSACEWAAWDSEAARETQQQFIGFVNDTVDGIPGVGHLKGGIHYAVGDTEGGDKAMKSASRTTGVMGGGVLGFLAGGPPGAVAGGIAGGLAMDGLTTGIDSAVHNEYRPSGMVSQVTEIVKDPTNPGLWFDTLSIPVFDGMSGVSAGKGAAKIANKIKAKILAYNQNKAAIVKKVGESSYKDVSKAANIARKHMGKGDVKQNVPQVITRVKDLKSKQSYTGCNRQLRQNLRKTRGGMSASQAKKNSVFKGSTKSNLQKRVPSAKKVLPRDPRSCAEHAAFQKLYKNHPTADPSKISTCTVKVNPRKGAITALKRCDNCMEYKSAMGSVPTDAIHGMPIYENPGYPVSKTGVALVAASAPISAIKQRSKASRQTGNKETQKSPAGTSNGKEEPQSKGKTCGEGETRKPSTKQEKSAITKYVKTKKLHRNRSGNVRMKKPSSVKAGRHVVSRVNEHIKVVTGSDSEQKTLTEDEWTSDFDDEGTENIHPTMSVKNR